MFRKFLILFAISVVTISSATSSPLAEAKAEAKLLLPGSTLSLSQVRSLSEKELTFRVSQAAGMKVGVNKRDLAVALASRGDLQLPIASQAGREGASVVVPMAVPNDANVKYNRPLAGNGRSSLQVCKDWGTSSCASGSAKGWLSNNQVSNASPLYWSDTDGYHHPSNSCMTQATALGLYYQFHSTAWVKLSGLWGGTWLLQMWCD